MSEPPSEHVLRAFGLRGAPEHLKGGISQTVWRVGDVVLKPVQEANPGEGDWVADVLDVIDEDGFRVSRPVRAENGAWLVGEWTAWRWLGGEHCLDRWRDVTEAARAFHRALPLAAARVGSRGKADVDRAANASLGSFPKRTVWHGAPLPTVAVYDIPEFTYYERAVALGPPLTPTEEGESQVVHGDVAGNVLVDPADDTLAFIDVSPGWRPASSVDAQIVVEGVAWFGGDEELLGEVSSADIARAIAFRFLCGFQALAIGAAFNPDEVARFVRVLDAIGA